MPQMVIIVVEPVPRINGRMRRHDRIRPLWVKSALDLLDEHCVLSQYVAKGRPPIILQSVAMLAVAGSKIAPDPKQTINKSDGSSSVQVDVIDHYACSKIKKGTIIPTLRINVDLKVS